jgi:hypothetical protein
MAAKYTKWPHNIPKRVKINQWKTKYTKSNGHPRRTAIDEIAFCEWVPVQPAPLDSGVLLLAQNKNKMPHL